MQHDGSLRSRVKGCRRPDGAPFAHTPVRDFALRFVLEMLDVDMRDLEARRHEIIHERGRKEVRIGGIANRRLRAAVDQWLEVILRAR